MVNAPPAQQPGCDGGEDQALPSVLKAIGPAARTLALHNAISTTCHGDRQRLAAYLEAMTPDQLVEVVAAARLLCTEADHALTSKAPGGCALPTDPAPDGS
ncbi:hypothetical protein AB0C28_24445 [Nonomuraea sp. NPDC048892]|uniref:hypothetical protein n=1 Tax=Nonomuraea sp. NPDC048892 TaxID=3154624 RepID=UPI0033F8EDE2